MTELEALCRKREHFETPDWAVRAILHQEPLQQFVVDPCCGAGILSRAALELAYEVTSIDIEDWGYPNTKTDFLQLESLEKPFDILMNPPFSLACEFIEKSFELGADKVLCFQRFAWWESRKRKAFWEKHRPSRVYICGDRADCWRHDIPKEGRGSSTPTAHAWFVFERDYKGPTELLHIWKG